jgi:Flp pilus assembly protein TadD
MNLINRVLRELDRRKATQTASRSLPSGVQPPEACRARRRSGWVLVTALAVALGGAAAWWATQRETTPAPAHVAGPPEPPPGPLARAPEPVAPHTAEPAPLPVPTPPAPAEPEKGASLPPPSTEREPVASAPPPKPPEVVRAPEPDLLDLTAGTPVIEPVEAGPAPTAAEAEFRNGRALLAKQRTVEAEAAWRSALELDPGHDLARRALASLLVSHDDPGGAEEVLTDGLRTHPAQSRVALMLAQLQMKRGAWSEAQRTLEAGLPYAQGNAAYLAATADLKARTGQQREAVRLYEAALHIAPDNPAWTLALAEALQEDGRTDEAYDVYLHALGLRSLDAKQRTRVEQKLRELGG